MAEPSKDLQSWTKSSAPGATQWTIIPSEKVDRSADWYRKFLDDVKTSAVEGEFGWRWALIEARHELGKLLVETAKEHGVHVFPLIKAVYKDTRLSIRTLFYCAKFYEKFPDLGEVPFEKNISYREIIVKYLTAAGDKAKQKEAKQAKAPSLPEVQPSEDGVQMYLKYLKEHACLACGAEPTEPHHWPKTKGAGAKEWECVPLCRACHTKYQERPTFFWCEEQKAITEYFYTAMILLFQEYVQLSKEQE